MKIDFENFAPFIILGVLVVGNFIEILLLENKATRLKAEIQTLNKRLDRHEIIALQLKK